MKVEKSDDCRSKPLETEDGMTSTARVRETDSRQKKHKQFICCNKHRQKKKDVEGARGRSLSTPLPFTVVTHPPPTVSLGMACLPSELTQEGAGSWPSMPSKASHRDPEMYACSTTRHLCTVSTSQATDETPPRCVTLPPATERWKCLSFGLESN